jgi:hypothetical protein
MSDYTTTEVEGTDLEQRDVRALTEYMTVLSEGGDIYTVVGQNGNGEYRVDARKERCTCPDHQYRGVECKHCRRVEFATGERAIPAWADTDEVDAQLGEHVTGTPKVAVTDGGVTLDEFDGDDCDDDRPEDCDCGDWNDGLGLCCWPCYREGYEVPNPDAAEGDDE